MKKLQPERWKVKGPHPGGVSMMWSLTDYSGADEHWTIWYPKIGGGAIIFRYGTQFAVAATYRGTSRHKAWFESFDAAALMCQLYVEESRSDRFKWNRRARREWLKPSRCIA